MSKETLMKDLEKLRSEINQISDDNPEARDKLIALINDLEKRLEGETDEDDENLLENIRDHISRFEMEHPRTTAILNDIMVTLSNMGI
jgi:hypothetical protein